MKSITVNGFELFESPQTIEEKFLNLVNIMKILRGKDGCPWDIEQTNDSIKNDTLEEAYELVEAINLKDDINLKEELGDVLLHVVFHSQIAADEQRFSVGEVIDGLNEKLIRRHPHVFGNSFATDSDDVLRQWDEIKKVEKSHTTITESLKSVPLAMPALVRASKIGKRAGKIGFDFQSVEEILDKLDEEVHEIKEAIEVGEMQHIEEEIGDLLLQIVNLSRFFQLNAENALTKSVEKFINRFEGVEQLAMAKGHNIADLSLMQMNELWDIVKLTS